MEPGGWLDDELWQTIQESVPVTCVDAMLWRDREGVRDVGLIARATPYEGERWCLVGGRLRLDEALTDGVRRELRSTLGVTGLDVAAQPHHVAEYRRDVGSGPRDPRKHAIGLTWVVEVTEDEQHPEPQPGGEARAFRWFPVTALPDLGFGQAEVVTALLRALDVERGAGGGRARAR